ncbi:MAG: four helix bundle protein, partial [Bacteroidales bacterium]|nr:four helix bundle protein [Bacteroidales bacterium]
YKEARESHYWVRLLKDTDYLNQEEANSLINDVEELMRIIGSIQKTMRENRNS